MFYCIGGGGGGTDVCCSTPVDTLFHPGSQVRPCEMLFGMFCIVGASTWSVGHECGLKFRIFLLYCCTTHGFRHTTLFLDGFPEIYYLFLGRLANAERLYILSDFADLVKLLYFIFIFGLIGGFYGKVSG